MLLGLATRILGQIYAKAKAYCQKLDLFLYRLFFYALHKQDTRRFEWHHWKLIRSWGLIIIGIVWLVPLLVLNVWYGVTTTGCASPRGRDWLGSFCADPCLNSAVQQRPPWYVDLWNSQDSITHHVRLPAQERNLVIGHHHICDAEHYFSDQLAKLALLPDDVKPMGLLPPAHVTLFCFVYHHKLTWIYSRPSSCGIIKFMPPTTDLLGFVLH